MKLVREFCEVAMFLFFMWWALTLSHCQPKPEAKTAVENAAAVAQYAALLDECRAKGRASNSYAVYQTCADAVDDHLCSQHRLRCPEDR